jgi:hypothetical protein
LVNSVPPEVVGTDIVIAAMSVPTCVKDLDSVPLAIVAPPLLQLMLTATVISFAIIHPSAV